MRQDELVEYVKNWVGTSDIESKKLKVCGWSLERQKGLVRFDPDLENCIPQCSQFISF